VFVCFFVENGMAASNGEAMRSLKEQPGGMNLQTSCRKCFNIVLLLIHLLRYPVFVVCVRVPPSWFTFFGDVSVIPHHIYPFPRGRKAFTRRRKRVDCFLTSVTFLR
jgi:hypothetical protein